MERSVIPKKYFGTIKARKYSNNSRICYIQREMAKRCIQLLKLPINQHSMLLDLGCGTGFSGEVLTNLGHTWIGCDLSRDMIKICRTKDVKGDLFHSDLGQGLYFRDCVFDGVISVSAIQWFCRFTKKKINPWRRLLRFFKSLFRILKQGRRAIFQLYPGNSEQLNIIVDMAKQTGFHAALQIDNPKSSKTKKYYLMFDSGTVIEKPLSNIKKKKSR